MVQVLATSKLVKAEREAAGLTQQALATTAGISMRTLARIEAGEDCNVSTLAALADALDIPVARLIEGAA
jgi:transcriptional regulator with XRE-family HTH domain